MKFSEISTIYQSYLPKIYKFFYYKTLDTHVAEDLTSETFLQFVTQVSREAEIKNETAYLYGIAKNVFLQYLRKRYQEKELLDYLNRYQQLDFLQYVDEVIQEIDTSPTLETLVIKYIDQLPDKQRDLVKMRLIDKKTPTEIATQIKKDYNYVRTTLKRGMKRLKEYVECTP